MGAIHQEIKSMLKLESVPDIVCLSGQGPESLQIYDSITFQNKKNIRIRNKIERQDHLMENVAQKRLYVNPFWSRVYCYNLEDYYQLVYCVNIAGWQKMKCCLLQESNFMIYSCLKSTTENEKRLRVFNLTTQSLLGEIPIKSDSLCVNMESYKA